MCPFLGASRKQPLHRLLSETFSSLWNGAGHHCRAPRFGQRQVQLRDHFGYRPIPEQPHAQDEPNHLLSRQSSTAQRSGARRCQGFFNPLGVDMSAKIFELLWSGEARYRCQRMVKTHRSLLSRSTHHDPQSPLLNVLVAPLKKPSIFDPLALTDRHWSRDRISQKSQNSCAKSGGWRQRQFGENGLFPPRSAAGRGIFVEALAGFSTELTGPDHLFEQLRGPKSIAAQLFVEILGHRQSDIQSNQIRELER